MKKVLGVAYRRLVEGHGSGFYRWLPWRLIGAKKPSPGKRDEIFVDVYPIYEDLDYYMVSGDDSYRWSALRSTVRAVRTGYSWSNGFREGASEYLGKVRDVMSKHLVPAIASGDSESLSVAHDALERFLTFLVDSSGEDLKSIIRTLQSLGFSADS